MCPIKTSDFFNHTLNKELWDIDIVRNLSEESFTTGSSILYAIIFIKIQDRVLFQRE